MRERNGEGGKAEKSGGKCKKEGDRGRENLTRKDEEHTVGEK